jgi:hypothetical protein
MAFYFMARRLVSWRPAAFVGGLLYGFSPFAVAEGQAHLFLVVEAIPPLVILLLDRCWRTKSDPPWRTGLLIGVCFAAQFFIATELFASMIVMALIAAVLYAAYWLVRRTPIDFRGLATLGGCAVAVIAVLAGYGIWMTVLGPAHVNGPEQTQVAIAGISSDPAGLVIPTTTQKFTFGHGTYGDSLVAQRNGAWQIVSDATVENGTYAGIPLLVVLLVGAVALRRKRFALFSGVMTLAALIMSFGARLHVGGNLTIIRLPFDVLTKLPLLKSGEAARYAIFFWLFAALLLTLILDGLYRSLTAEGARPALRWRGTAACAVVALVALIPLVPAWPYSAGPAYVPAWFTTTARSLPVGTTVVVYPFASPVDPTAMAWQAMADDTFKMPGGYAVFDTGPNRTAMFYGTPTVLGDALVACTSGLAPGPLTPEGVRSQVHQWGATHIVVAAQYEGSACAEGIFSSAFGPPRHHGQVLSWQVGASH